MTDEEDEEEESFDAPCPTLLFGLSKPASKEELLSDIPSRPVTDRLISQFFNSKEPFIGKFWQLCYHTDQQLTFGGSRLPRLHIPERGMLCGLFLILVADYISIINSGKTLKGSPCLGWV